MSDETVADIVAELRQDYKGRPPINRAETTWCRRLLADRIEEAARREAAKLIPARNIKFYDGYGRRQVSYGWVKVGSVSPASHPIVQQDVFAGKVHRCSFCVADCPIRGSDVLVICERFKESGVGK